MAVIQSWTSPIDASASALRGGMIAAQGTHESALGRFHAKTWRPHMAEALSMASGSVERFPFTPGSTSVTDELIRIGDIVRGACPPDATIGFSFEGRLQLHIDVRKREHVLFVETVLPTLGAGLFSGLSVGSTPGHPFHHRISAVVAA
jgi:hypothetical protein